MWNHHLFFWLYKRFQLCKKTKNHFFPWPSWWVMIFSRSFATQKPSIARNLWNSAQRRLNVKSLKRQSQGGQLVGRLELGSLTCKKIGTFMIDDDIDAWDMIDDDIDLWEIYDHLWDMKKTDFQSWDRLFFNLRTLFADPNALKTPKESVVFSSFRHLGASQEPHCMQVS